MYMKDGRNFGWPSLVTVNHQGGGKYKGMVKKINPTEIKE